MMVSMKKLTRVLSVCALLFGACQSGSDSLLGEQALQLKTVQWNAKSVSTGTVFAVADLNEDTVVFSSLGAMVFTAGLPLYTDAAVQSWKSATVVPAGNLAGSWLMGVDGAGKVRRLRDRSLMEDVSDRYGLNLDNVSDVVAVDPTTRTAFSLGAELAVSDGAKVTRYPLAFSQISGGSGRVAGIVDGSVRTFDARSGDLSRFDVSAPVGTLIDTAGRLVVATENALYRESGSSLAKLYESSDAPIRGLVLSSGVVWVQIGDTLAVLDEAEVRRAQAGMIPADGKLISSSTGDVWVLSQGTLKRFGEDTGGGASEDQWKNTVQPVFTRLCSLCHMPGGSANMDLSTYKSWVARKDAMRKRVVEMTPSPMPPKGAGALTQDELMAVSAWLDTVP